MWFPSEKHGEPNRLLSWLRVHWNVDCTLLGWPGRRFWFAHLRYKILYGKEDYLFRSNWAKERHAYWVKEHYTLTIRPSFFGGVYVNAKEPPKEPRD